jgi:glycosyltransferase involved in cell wall biosynthesis
MDYPPNIDAALRTIDRLMPPIRAAHPEVRFHIVGRAPDSQLTALDGQNGTCVWGEVPDVRPFLAGADLVLAPLRIARGIQNKVLEAMAMARPVVLTPAAATGIPALDGVHCAIADTDEALIESVLALLAAPTSGDTLGSTARGFVVEQMNWSAMLAALPGLVGRADRQGDAA